MSDSSKELAGKRAVVTGAGTGIGEGVALALAAAGASVVLHYAFEDERAEHHAESIRAAGGDALAIRADLSDPVACRHVLDAAGDFLGGIDILVNNAGMTWRGDFLDVTPEDFARVYDLNVRGYFFVAQQAVRWMLRRGEQPGGVIVNLSSIHATHSMPSYSVYASAKGAIDGMTRQLSAELARHRIRVNAIAPGMVVVDRHRRMPAFDEAKAEANSPWGRLATPADVGRLVIYLASDAALYVTGQIVPIDGGVTSRQPGSPLPLKRPQTQGR